MLYIVSAMKTDRHSTGLDFARELDFSEILTNPILDIAAWFWEADRYEAFRVTYRSMRRIDDLVDDRKVTGDSITPAEAELLRQSMTAWLEQVRQGVAGLESSGQAGDEFTAEFVATVDRFAMPLWPWERLCKAMTYDLLHEGFASFRAFLRYTEGAAISPAAVFMHLCGVEKAGDRFLPPRYDIREAARPLAIFSYLVHIMRDFQKDQLAGLNYFADDLIAKHGLTVADLREMAKRGQVDERLRALMAEYKRFGEYYRRKARRVVDRTLPLMGARYQLSMEVIYGLYLQIFERIDPDQGEFSGVALMPTPAQVQAAIDDIVGSFIPVEN